MPRSKIVEKFVLLEVLKIKLLSTSVPSCSLDLLIYRSIKSPQIAERKERERMEKNDKETMEKNPKAVTTDEPEINYRGWKIMPFIIGE